MFRTGGLRSGAAAALILTGVVLAGGVANQTLNLPDKLTASRPRVCASLKQESDAPSRELMMRRFGFGTAPFSVHPPLAPASPDSPAAPAAPTAVSNWVQLGPTQITDVGSSTILEPSLGRVNAVAVSPVDPNRILVGAGSGGVWISSDGGQVWTPVGDNLPVLGVSDIEFAPSNPNIVYMTTGDANAFATPSVGVYKSTDGGSHWFPTGLVFDQAAFTIMSKLAVDPSDPNTVYAVSTNFIHKTTDGGGTWTIIRPSGIIGGDFPSYDVKLRPGNPSVVYHMGPSGAFRVSNDKGATWSGVAPGIPVGSVQRCQIAVTPADSNAVYVICANNSSGLADVYRSSNGGASFSSTSGGGPSSDTKQAFGFQAGYDMSIAVSPTNPNDVYIGGVLPLHSSNGGATWQSIYGDEGGIFPGLQVAHVDVHELLVTGGTLYAGTDGGIHRSADAGAHWTDLSQRLCIAQIYHFGTSEQNPSLVYAGEQDNGLNRLNGGKWEHVRAGDWDQPTVHPQSTDLVFAGSNGGDVKTLDGFNNFVVPLNVTNEPKAFPGAPFAVDPNDLHVAYTGYRNVFKSVDFGDPGTWSQMTSFTDNSIVVAMAIAPSNTQVIYASRVDRFNSDAQMIRSTTGGTNFGNAGNGLPAKGVASQIAIDPANPDRAWVALEGEGLAGNVVYRTENGGASWTNYTGSLTTLSAHAIVYQKGTNDAVYVGTNAGVFYRDASMADWSPFNTNLPNAVVSDLAINYGSGRLRAATFGRGVWETLLPGTTLNALLNISTRLHVGTGDNILIAGFILTGPGNKTVMLRAIGPSLAGFIPGALADPTLELRDGAGAVIGTNDNWKVTNVGGVITGNQFFAIKSSGIAPSNDSEAAIIASLPPGNYGAVLRGANNSTGIAVVEGYDLSQATARFGNISTRGFVQTGNGAMIAGFILGNQNTRVVVRAIGPSLGAFGVPTPLANPTLELRDSNGALLTSNDNWKTRPDGSSQEADISSTGLAPSNDVESALVTTVPPGAYTAIVRGANDGIGNAVVEVYNLQ